jgi:protein-serine/threonine kinase
MGGGDLLNLLIERDVFEEEFTRFYVAEVRSNGSLFVMSPNVMFLFFSCTPQMILAIETCHKHGFIHRDIKPDVGSHFPVLTAGSSFTPYPPFDS